MAFCLLQGDPPVADCPPPHPVSAVSAQARCFQKSVGFVGQALAMVSSAERSGTAGSVCRVGTERFDLVGEELRLGVFSGIVCDEGESDLF